MMKMNMTTEDAQGCMRELGEMSPEEAKQLVEKYW